MSRQNTLHHKSDFLKLKSRYHNNDFPNSDVVLLVEDERLHVSKVILSIASPVFNAMFTSDFEEKNKREISLPGKKVKDLVLLLDCIYPDTCTPITGDNVFTVLPLADEYQLSALKERCEVVLLKVVSRIVVTGSRKVNEGGKVVEHLRLADKYHLRQLETTCVCLLSEMSQYERDQVFQFNEVEADKKIAILKMSVERFEMAENDDIKVFGSSNVIEQVHKYFLYEVLYQNNRDRLAALRFAYRFRYSNRRDIYEELINTTKKMKRPNWDRKEYELLPSQIKRDLEQAVENL